MLILAAQSFLIKTSNEVFEYIVAYLIEAHMNQIIKIGSFACNSSFRLEIYLFVFGMY